MSCEHRSEAVEQAVTGVVSAVIGGAVYQVRVEGFSHRANHFETLGADIDADDGDSRSPARFYPLGVAGGENVT